MCDSEQFLIVGNCSPNYTMSSIPALYLLNVKSSSQLLPTIRKCLQKNTKCPLGAVSHCGESLVNKISSCMVIFYFCFSMFLHLSSSFTWTSRLFSLFSVFSAYNSTYMLNYMSFPCWKSILVPQHYRVKHIFFFSDWMEVSNLISYFKSDLYNLLLCSCTLPHVVSRTEKKNNHSFHQLCCFFFLGGGVWQVLTNTSKGNSGITIQ